MALGLRSLATAELTEDEVASIRRLLEDAFGEDEDERFADSDWAHALGGLHVVADDDGEIVGHASVVPRSLEAGPIPLRTGYVEAVATRRDRQGSGIGTDVMRLVGEHIDATYALGALGTGAFHFYERLGWERWPGPTAVRTADGVRATTEDDGYVMILRTRRTPMLDPSSTLSCEWREGDVW
jgi:aminoglycoside 2'-N-acetyltransferase I